MCTPCKLSELFQANFIPLLNTIEDYLNCFLPKIYSIPNDSSPTQHKFIFHPRHGYIKILLEQ